MMEHIKRIVAFSLLFFLFADSHAAVSVADGRSIAAYGTGGAYLIDYIGPDGFGNYIYELYRWDPVSELWILQCDECPSLGQMDMHSDETRTSIIGTDETGTVQRWKDQAVGPNAWNTPYSGQYDWVLYEQGTYNTMGLMQGFDGIWKTLAVPGAPGPGEAWYKYLSAGPDVSDKMKNYWFVDRDTESFTKWERGDEGYAVALNRGYASEPFRIYYYGDSEPDALGYIDGSETKGANVDTVIVKRLSYDEIYQNLWCVDTSGVPWQWDNGAQDWIMRDMKSCVGVAGKVLAVDYTSNCPVYGDLILVNASVNVNTPGGLEIYGDLKILSGQVFMGPNGGPLRVFGDLIITNTMPGLNSMVITHSSLDVGGVIFTRSKYGEAIITTTGAVDEDGYIKASGIVTRGYENSSIYTNSDVIIPGEIDLHSTNSLAFAWVQTGSLSAGSIKTNAKTDGYVLAQDIFVVGDVGLLAVEGDAYVKSSATNIYANQITTSAGNDGYVESAEGVDVLGAINLTGTSGDAYVLASGTTITAGSIMTNAYGDGTVTAEELVLVNGDVHTKSTAGNANVVCTSGPIIAVNVFTNGYSGGYVEVASDQNINVRRSINLFSSNGSADVKDNLNLLATSVTTSGGNSAYVNSDGFIRVAGVINTFSPGNAYVTTGNGGDLFAESIFTSSGSAYVTSDGDLFVKDIVSVKSESGNAYVSSARGISARSITTTANSSAVVAASAGSIDVVGDIRTYSGAGNAYIEASADVNARSIRTIAPSGNDYIKAGPGSGRFKLFVDSDNTELTLENSEFYIDQNHYWNTLLSIEGTCTFDGNSCRLAFGPSGGIEVKQDATLLLKNIKLDNVWGNKIRCEDNSATFSFMSVSWTQTGDTVFDTGSMQLLGDLIINGTDTTFLYSSAITSSINENGALIFSHGVTLSYDAATDQKIWLSDSTSKIKFDAAKMYASEDIRFTKGRVVLDNLVTFSIGVGKTCYFGGENSDFNVTLDPVLGSEFKIFGAIDYANV